MFSTALNGTVGTGAAPSRISKEMPGVCASASDCSLLGQCSDGRCHCSPGYTGPTCGQLDLQPVSSFNSAQLWPQPGVPNSSAWGFTVAYDPADRLYHAVVDVSCGCDANSSVHACTEFTGVLASGGYASSLVHLQSSRPDRDFKFVGVIAPSTSFNPHLVRSPAGLFALYFRVNAVDTLPLCSGKMNGPTSMADSLIKVCAASSEKNCIHAGEASKGTNMYVATSHNMTGPWNVEPVGVAGEGSLHVSNPSVVFVAPGTPAFQLGKVAMAFRYNSPHGVSLKTQLRRRHNFIVLLHLLWATFETRACHGVRCTVAQENNGIAFADTPAGPFRAVANLSWASPPDAHSTSSIGDKTPTSISSTLQLRRRERPELHFNPKTGDPDFLYNGASVMQRDEYKAFSLVQSVRIQ